MPSLRRMLMIYVPILSIVLIISIAFSGLKISSSIYWHGRGFAAIREWVKGISEMVATPATMPQLLALHGDSAHTWHSSNQYNHRFADRRPWNSSHITNLYIFPIIDSIQPIPAGPWADIAMPTKSFFADFEAPRDSLRWNQALLQAARGEQVLLDRILRVVRSPGDLFENDKDFKWLHRLADLHKSATKEDNWLADLGVHSHTAQNRASRAPIVMYGYRKFDHPNHEGRQVGIPSMGPGEIIRNAEFTVPRKMVVIGNADENWGWLSTYFLNRTVPWAMSFTDADNPFKPGFKYPQQQVQHILDNENIVALFVSQHHNITHPKVISMPLGLEASMARDTYTSMMKAGHKGLKKDTLLYSAGSNYAFRPSIRACIEEKFNGSKEFLASAGKVSKEHYRARLLSSMASVAMPGLGYDTYRLWETLASGAMPVVERGMGMDRTFYRLPVLMLDDYADLTPELLRTAYVEALYLADQWEYERMTKRWWERLIFEVSFSSSTEPLLHYHPMRAQDTDFTRPLVPFDCVKMGGCGKGTRRVPRKSCGIDISLVSDKYNFRWKHE